MGQSTLVILAVFIVVKHIIVGHVIIQQLVIYQQQSVENDDDGFSYSL
jgi:hypothetical protein